MKTYRSVSAGTGVPSGVKAYHYGRDYITVWFNGGHRYKYTYSSCGINHVETMKLLADRQNGLSTYIAKHQPVFAEKD
jgi:hypothetical protein